MPAPIHHTSPIDLPVTKLASAPSGTADKARQQASRYHLPSLFIRDLMIEEILLADETEPLKLAESLEAQAARLMPG